MFKVTYIGFQTSSFFISIVGMPFSDSHLSAIFALIFVYIQALDALSVSIRQARFSPVETPFISKEPLIFVQQFDCFLLE